MVLRLHVGTNSGTQAPVALFVYIRISGYSASTDLSQSTCHWCVSISANRTRRKSRHLSPWDWLYVEFRYSRYRFLLDVSDTFFLDFIFASCSYLPHCWRDRCTTKSCNLWSHWFCYRELKVAGRQESSCAGVLLRPLPRHSGHTRLTTSSIIWCTRAGISIYLAETKMVHKLFVSIITFQSSDVINPCTAFMDHRSSSLNIFCLYIV